MTPENLMPNLLSNGECYHVGGTYILSELIDRIDLVQQIDQALPEKRKDCQVSIGTRIKALVLNLLDDRVALYQMPSWAETQDLDWILGEGIRPEQLNDDAMGRALDAMDQIGLDSIFFPLSLKALQVAGIPLDQVLAFHTDTTSKSLHGGYENPEEVSSLITLGFSKDHRPDLKQIKYGLSVVEGIPFYADVHAGNTTDPQWNGNVLSKLKKELPLKQLGKMIYVADAGFCTKENLKQVQEQGFSFITRCPDTFGVTRRLKEKAVSHGKGEEIHIKNAKKQPVVYHIQSFPGEIDGMMYRFLVIHSSALREKKEKRWETMIQKERQSLEKEIKKESQEIYTCESDAAKAAKKWMKKQRKSLHLLSFRTVAKEVIPTRNKRGRPKTGEPFPEEILIYQNEIELSSPEESTREEWLQKESSFVLVTNLSSKEQTNPELLQTYKEQYRVEQRFRFLKNPYFVNAIYLHTPRRVKAFAYVMLIAILIYSLLEHMLRKAIGEETEPLILPGDRKSHQPTGLSILKLLQNMTVMKIPVGSTVHRSFLLDSSKGQFGRICELLGMNLTEKGISL